MSRRDEYRGSYRGDRYSDRRNDRDRDLARDIRRDPRRLSPPPAPFDSRNGSRESRQPRLDPSPRRDSWDRKRERSPERDRARHGRSRERLRDYPSYRNDSRERKRPRHDDYRDHGYDRKVSREEEMRLAREQAQAEEDAKRKAEEAKQAKFAERQARIAKMKERQALEEAQNKSPAESPAPATPALADTPGSGSEQTLKLQVGDRMGGRFDPKEIAKRAKIKLANLDSAPATSDGFKKADLPKTIGQSLAAGSLSTKRVAADLNMTQDKAADTAPQMESDQILDLGEDEPAKRSLKMLPTIPDDTDAGWQDGESSEETNDESPVKAVKAVNKDGVNGADPTSRPPSKPRNSDPDTQMADDDELDPLDAFMNDLENTSDNRHAKVKSRNKLAEVGVTFSDDEDGIIDAIGDDDFTAVKVNKKTKRIPTVDHSSINYEPFRKDFYTEPQDLQDMSEEDVKSLRFELDDIKITGRDAPKPVQKFAQFGLGSHVLDIIRTLGFEQPTSIQAQATPAIMSGRDVIGVAKTGSGKTIAFLLPMFRHIKDQRPLEDMEGPIGLIVAPTRELASQIHAGCKPFLKALKLRAACVVGGTKLSDDIAKMKSGSEIVVATPGRLIELMTSNSGRILNLQRVTYVVMDEADRMFDMGFEPQITQVLQNIRPDRQCVLFSATFPRKMESLARKLLDDPVQITVGGRSVVPKEITQKVEVVPDADKFGRLVGLISEELQDDDDKRVLVFVERQETADTIFLQLTRAGFPCVSVHGGREQMDRDEALADFKAGHVPIMVATSVAARGLDVKQLTLVINFDVPSHLEDYVHRAGRTGRAGATGTAVTLITPDQGRYSVDVVKALTQSETPVPEDLQSMADTFWKKVKEGTEKRWGSSGFGGHGLEKLEKEHNAEQNRQRRQFRTADQPDEEEEVVEEPKIDSKVAAALENVSVAQKTGRSAIDDEVDSFFGKVERKAEADRTPATSQPGASLGGLSARIAALNSKHGGATSSVRAGVSMDNRGPDAGEYFFKLDVNEMPQKARWAVTNRGNVAKVLESTGVSITTKGQYYAPNIEPGPNDQPKMSLLIEGPTEISVNSAVAELKRYLKEAIVSSETASARAPVGGRYTVV